MSKKILIIGNSANAYAFAKKISVENEVFVAPGSDTIKEFATCVDIREDSVTELLEYVMENDIDLTVSLSKKVLNANIAEIFANNNQAFFGPTANAMKFVADKALLKKVLYKLRIPTPKFGIFEKQNMILDYIKNLKNPFVLKTNETSSAVVLTSYQAAKNIVDAFFAQKTQKVIIEDYVWGTPFSFYTITDGYKALPIGSSVMYKHSLEGDGGQLTSGMGACVPNYKLSIENEYFLMDNVVYPILESLEQEGNPYLGILGISGVITEEGQLQILGLESFLQDADTDAILEILDADILELMNSCIIGSFSDEVDFIPQKDLTATALVLHCNTKNNIENSIEGLDLLDEDVKTSFYPTVAKNRYLEYEANTGSVAVITAFGRTVSSSTNKIYDEVKTINFKGINYRKDICKSLVARF